MTPAKNLGSPAGDWLFRQGELILGPVPATHIVERLYSGELDARTEVAPLGQPTFQRLATIDQFKVHVAKAEAKLRVESHARDEQVRTGRRAAVKVAIVIAVCCVVGALAAAAAKYLAVHAPISNDEEEALFEIEAPVIRLARARAVDNDDFVDYPSGSSSSAGKKGASASPTPGPTPSSPSGKSASTTGKNGKPTKVASADRKGSNPASPVSRMSTGSNDPDGMQTAEFDQGAINSVVAAKQKTLYPCLKTAMQRKPDAAGKIPIEFVIGNDGKVAKLWIDHPDFKDASLHECMLRELQKWPFKPYTGERATVGLAFKLSGKAK